MLLSLSGIAECRKSLGNDPPKELEIVLDDGTQDVLPDLDYLITEFSHQRAEHPIYVDKRFFSDFQGLNGLTVADQARFGSYDFYLRPTLVASNGELTDAWKNRTLVASPQGSEPTWKMTLRLTLISEGRRKAAALAINQKFPNANVSPKRIKLIPFRHLEVRANLATGLQTVVSIPKLDLTNSPQERILANTPEAIEISIRGDESSLQQFVREPSFDGVCIIKGLAIRTNIANLTAHIVVKNGLHHVLTGNASWDQFVEFKHGAGKELKPNQLNMSLGSSVTRSQVREISNYATSSIRGIVLESEGGKVVDMQSASQQMLKQLLDFAEKENIVNIVNEGTKFVIDEGMVQGLTADKISELNSIVQKEIDEANEQYRKDTDKEGSQEKKEMERWRDNNGITWKVEGGIVVPKTVSLYQFNQSHFERTASQVFVTAIARKGTAKLEVPVEIGSFGVLAEVDYLRFVNVDDDDEDMKGFSLVLEFLDSGDQVISTWTQTRGEISVGDGNRRFPEFQNWVREGSDKYSTDFFCGTTHRVTKDVSKVRIKVWAASADNTEPGDWHPFEKIVEPVDGEAISIHGGWIGGSTLDEYNGRHIEVKLTISDL